MLSPYDQAKAISAMCRDLNRGPREFTADDTPTSLYYTSLPTVGLVYLTTNALELTRRWILSLHSASEKSIWERPKRH